MTKYRIDLTLYGIYYGIYLFICISHSEIPITRKISVSLTFSRICYNKYENYIQFNRHVASDNEFVILWDIVTRNTVIVHWTRYRMYCPHGSRKVKDNSKLIRYSRFKIPLKMAVTNVFYFIFIYSQRLSSLDESWIETNMASKNRVKYTKINVTC